MRFLLSGYYGCGNAGDEAVLAAIIDSISSCRPGSSFTVTSGDPTHTSHRFNGPQNPVTAIGRQQPRALVRAIRSCDVFISGGGSLLQDVTSLRNIIYYTALIRFALWSRRPVMIYAQGIGPLLRPLSQKLTRAAVNGARAVTVRDDDSKSLLQKIGVTRAIEVTADPVWALAPAQLGDEGTSRQPSSHQATWGLSLRPWAGYEFDTTRSTQITDSLLAAAKTGNARWRCIPMQESSDRATMEPMVREGYGEMQPTAALHPREIMALCGRCDAMIAMRLHALIFAAAQGVPCVAINYDPKVAALAAIIGAPLLSNLSPSEGARLPDAVNAAKPMDLSALTALKRSALRNAELAVGLA